jgi:hypothetical protein
MTRRHYDKRTVNDDDALLRLLEQLDGEGWEIVEVVYQRGLDRLALLRAPRDDYLVIIRRPAAADSDSAST